jgi:uncharacterized protein (TIGR03437 family)
MRLLLAFVLCAASVAGQGLEIVSAANYRRNAPVAPEMIVTVLGSAITAGDSYGVMVRDSAGVERAATVFGVAPGQLSFVLPTETSMGTAAVTVRRGSTTLGIASASVGAVSPGIFTANASGAGVPAGLAMLVESGGRRNIVDLFQWTGAMFLPRPLMAASEDVYLLLFGTGIRGYRDRVTAAIAGEPVPVAGVAAQGEFAGLDQANLGPLARGISGARGEAELVLTVDGVAANAVTIALNGPPLAAWGTRGRLLEPNSEFAVAELGGKIYVLGGYPANRQTKDTVQVYDPVTDQWELAPPMPVPLNHNMAAAAGGKLYMIGGQFTDAGAGNFSDRVFEYDPAARQWRERARMPTARGAGVAVVVDGKIYVAGGRPPRGADFAVYDPQADSWRTLPDLPTQRNHLAGAAAGGKVYILGGRFEGGATSPQSDAVEVYDPVANRWTSAAPLPRPRGGVNGLEALGCIHLFGGEGNTGGPNGLYPDHDVYNPVANSWTRLGPMPIPVHGVTGAAFVGGLIYLPGGGTSQGGNSGSLNHQVFRPDMVCR